MASLASLATISLGSNPVDSGFAFFLVAEFVLLCCLLGYLLISCSVCYFRLVSRFILN